jgi:hypothetical protein
VIDMNPINDNDLILYHYRDGLDGARLGEIEQALLASGELRSRYTRLTDLLGNLDTQAPEPAPGFERRLLADLDRHLFPAVTKKTGEGLFGRWIAFLRGDSAGGLLWVGSLASILVIALGIGFLAGRGSNPDPVAAIPAGQSKMASRVLDAYVAGHLRATEGVLMTAANTEGGALLVSNRELAEALVESNRMYAIAAARAGNPRLADFLHQLEPVLIGVANQSDTESIESRQGLRDYLSDTDLLFQVRATESRIDADSKRKL